MLKPDREILHTDISFYMDEQAERGGIAVVLTSGSGGGWKTTMGDTHNVVTYAANPAGKRAAGVLLNDMVPLQYNNVTRAEGVRDEMPVGSKCALLRRGWIHTDKYTGAPTGLSTAYVGPSGLFSPTQASGAEEVGHFMGSPNEDGFVRVYVSIP